MKPTKRIEAEVLDVYQKWLHSYLNGDVATYNSYFDDAFHFIGSTNNEEFLTRNDTTNFFKVTSEQLAGKTQLRNETKIVEQFGELVFITHLFDAWFLNGLKWVFYGRFRFSNTLMKNKEGWRFIYQHYSTPDSKAQEGETIGYDQISKENLQLREAIQRRTIELESRNRELEIEGALARIRAQAVAMQQSTDLLDIVVTMRNEFTKLGHEAHYFWHMMWLPETYEKAMTSGDGSKIGFVMKLPRHMHGDIPLLAKWEKSKKPTVVYAMDTDEAIDYVDKMVNLGNFQSIDPQAPTHDDIRHIGGLTFIMARTTHGEIGFSLPGIVENPPKKDLEILVQFAGAFDLAHQRFLDLQKAEKQAREVQIELALEKVRSRTMAMQRSDELQETSFLLDQQVRALGIETWGCAFNIYGENESAEWFGNEKGVLPTYTVPRTGIFKKYFEKGKKGETLIVQEFSGKACVDHYENMSTLPVIGDVLKKLKETNNGFPTYQIDHVVYFKYGYLLFITKEHVPDAYDIFKRFAKVFEQTYTRFLDLQKAEAQAKEAQIEASLERIRSRSMAMQKSSELLEAGELLWNEITKLGIDSFTSGYVLMDDKENIGWNYTPNPSTGKILEQAIGIPHKQTPPMRKILASWKKQEPLCVVELTRKQTISHQTFVAEKGINFPFSAKELVGISPQEIVIHSFNFKQGYLMIIGGEKLAKSQIDVMLRFTKVFQQTYTRFLDLKKAEAQAKEAQIELGLERVRARAMAMKHSDELSDLVATVLSELTKLDFALTWCIINIINEADQSNMVWATNPEGGTAPESYYMKFEDYPFHHAMMKAWKAQKSEFVYVLEGKEKKIYDDYLYNETEFKRFSNKVKKANRALDKYVASFTFSNFGGLQTVASEPLSDENLDILVRFGKVFDLTYTRFNDLEKAEKQARESEIELALERVRARTMAMQKSEEIGQVAQILFQQLKSLGGELWGTGFGLCEKNSDVDEYWFANEKGIMPRLNIPNNVDPAHKQMYEGWKKNLELLAITKGGKELKEHYKYMLTVPDVQSIFQGMLDNGIAFPKWQKWHAAYFKYGYLLVITTEEYKNEVIFNRFAKVFEQAYTRFLDLQKAEAQTKEAQIEAALERVRSRSMAMHNSDELKDVIKVIFDQMGQLKINADHAGIVVDYEPKKDFHFWVADHQAIPAMITVPYLDLPWDRQFTEAKKKGTDFFITQLDFEEKNSFYKKLLPHIKGLTKQAKDFYLNCSGLAASTVIQKDIGLYIENFSALPFSDAENSILMRFGKVFQQTYTRFIDLQKAEAQAREAQIETALERVRSSAMAMHKSDDLTKAVDIVFSELKQLEFNTVRCGIGIFNDQSNKVNVWTTSSNNKKETSQLSGDEKLEGHPLLDGIYNAWKKQVDFSYTLKNKDLENYYQVVSNSNLPVSPPNDDNKLTTQYYHVVVFPAGGLFAFSDSEFTQDKKLLMKRFGEVFHLSFTRHLDLKQAEAQAREAQIEMALEKVRSRTMAMQKSEELPDAANVLFTEVQKLGIPAWSCGYNILSEDKKSSTCIMSSEGEIQSPFILPLTKHKSLKPWHKAILNNENFYVYEQGGKDLEEHYNYMQSLPDLKETFQQLKDAEISLPTFQVNHLAKFKNGFLLFITYERVSESHDIFQRFAKVFQQTYTRFLDLEKAEAQAREAQIEMALEKVRSRTMAMQKSEELPEVGGLLYQELSKLGLKKLVSGYVLFDETATMGWNYGVNPIDGSIRLKPVGTNYTKNKVMKRIAASWQKQEPLLVIELNAEDLLWPMKA